MWKSNAGEADALQKALSTAAARYATYNEDEGEFVSAPVLAVRIHSISSQ